MYDVIPFTTGHQTACGPAALKMLLGYYDVDVDIDILIDECGVNIGGCTAGDLKRVGRAHGLDMTAYSMDAEELIKQDKPAIIWWKYSHWCVFAGRDDKGDVVICNPSRGRFAIDRGSFATLYTGVSLWNGEPQPLPEPEPSETEDLAEAARILMGVSE